jgi:hypothetical protein
MSNSSRRKTIGVRTAVVAAILALHLAGHGMSALFERAWFVPSADALLAAEFGLLAWGAAFGRSRLLPALSYWIAGTSLLFKIKLEGGLGSTRLNLFDGTFMLAFLAMLFIFIFLSAVFHVLRRRKARFPGTVPIFVSAKMGPSPLTAVQPRFPGTVPIFVSAKMGLSPLTAMQPRFPLRDIIVFAATSAACIGLLTFSDALQKNTWESIRDFLTGNFPCYNVLLFGYLSFVVESALTTLGAYWLVFGGSSKGDSPFYQRLPARCAALALAVVIAGLIFGPPLDRALTQTALAGTPTHAFGAIKKLVLESGWAAAISTATFLLLRLARRKEAKSNY